MFVEFYETDVLKFDKSILMAMSKENTDEIEKRSFEGENYWIFPEEFLIKVGAQSILCEAKNGLMKKKYQQCFICGINACYGYDKSAPNYCVKHKLFGMINVFKSICLDCDKCASFNYTGSKKKLYCVTHKKDNMVNISTKKCLDCDTCASYNYPGFKTKLYCNKHKKDGMANTSAKKCLKCNKRPSFNYKGSSRGLYCNDHKRARMINIFSKKCLKCNNKPLYGFASSKKKVYCAFHSVNGMIKL